MKVGSLFSGYGGLDLAVGGELAWYSEIEPAACKVLAAHHPGVPNLGDVTKVDWAAVAPVDVLTAGYPCQPFSSAGNRKGTSDERHLWPYVRDALSAIRPHRAVLENVRGHLSLGFDIVLADLADLGWSARWGVVRASDAGAPHQRARLFILAANRNTDSRARDGWRQEVPHLRPTQHKQTPAQPTGTNRDAADPAGAERGATESDNLQARGAAESGERPSCSATTWGDYAPAIDRWEHITGRPAPAPVVTTPRGQRLSPSFVEWMMGLPQGWVTGHNLTHCEELKMLGNGVVPQQAALALNLLAAA